MKYNIGLYRLKLSKLHQRDKTLRLCSLAHAPRETAALFRNLTYPIFKETSAKYYG